MTWCRMMTQILGKTSNMRFLKMRFQFPHTYFFSLSFFLLIWFKPIWCFGRKLLKQGNESKPTWFFLFPITRNGLLFPRVKNDLTIHADTSFSEDQQGKYHFLTKFVPKFFCCVKYFKYGTTISNTIGKCQHFHIVWFKQN